MLLTNPLTLANALFQGIVPLACLCLSLTSPGTQISGDTSVAAVFFAFHTAPLLYVRETK